MNVEKDPLPLLGKTVVVTRARDQAADFVERLEALGAEVIEFPTIEVRPVPFFVDDLSHYDWIVFTSTNGVSYFLRGLNDPGRQLEALRNVKVCGVGPATEQAARQAGIAVDFVPEEFIAEGVLAALRRREPDLAGKHFLLPRGDLARTFLPQALRQLGAEVTELVVYRTVMPETDEAKADALVAAAPDVVAFTSSSTVSNFAKMMGKSRLEALKRTARFAAIGPKTSETAAEHGIIVTIEPRRHDTLGLIEAIVGEVSG